jgi:hypothetical protein
MGAIPRELLAETEIGKGNAHASAMATKRPVDRGPVRAAGMHLHDGGAERNTLGQPGNNALAPHSPVGS